MELRGLKSKPEMNGQRGIVEAFDAFSGRCSVQLEDNGGMNSIKLKNLSPLEPDDGEEESAAPKADPKLVDIIDRFDDLVDREDKLTEKESHQVETYSGLIWNCLLYTSPSPRDGLLSRMPSSA